MDIVVCFTKEDKTYMINKSENNYYTNLIEIIDEGIKIINTTVLEMHWLVTTLLGTTFEEATTYNLSTRFFNGASARTDQNHFIAFSTRTTKFSYGEYEILTGISPELTHEYVSFNEDLICELKTATHTIHIYNTIDGITVHNNLTVLP